MSTTSAGGLRFGVDVPTSAAPGADPVAAAQAAERLGFDFVSASDHPCGTRPSFELWTMLTWIAAATTRISVASRVLAVPLRTPAMIAKAAESLDRLSGGRLILGLGGGYADAEFRAFGLPVPTPREKVDGLAEAIGIIRGLWAEPGFSYPGRIYHTEAADLEPKPAHHIPIWLGTYGDRALGVTGRLADGWIPSLGFAAPDRLPAMRERVLAAARAAGRLPQQVTCVLNVSVRVGDRATADPDAVTGPAGQVADELTRLAAVGFTAFNLMPIGLDRDEQLHRLATEVLPAVRAAGQPG
jgi:alkanesulfonate monooxygenase SsuD/methylene tetrahydromethanopterin reductase-like flavin-dependent oxidoreductase (luciferase family)